MKRVLIISYYWLPSGGSGVQRWLYFVKYLREFGWEPVVFTVEKGEYPYLDHSLKNQISDTIEIIRSPIWEPYTFYKRMFGAASHATITPTIFLEGKKFSLRKRLAIWIRGNFFIPDPRVFWKRKAVKEISKYYAQHPFDAIISTGPPHSCHLIAQKIHSIFNIPWISDFRDPWTQGFTYSQMNLSTIADRIHKDLEQKVLKQSTRIVTVSQSCKQGLEALAGRSVDVITNGYEPFEKKDLRDKEKIVMLYTGALSLDRNPQILWEKLEEYVRNKEDLCSKFWIKFIGTIDPTLIEYIRTHHPFIQIECSGPQSHQDIESALNAADGLLLIGVRNEPGVVTGKLFEYLYSQKPILSVSPTGGDIAQILHETNGGVNVDFDDALAMEKAIQTFFAWIENDQCMSNTAAIEQYSRKKLTEKMADILNDSSISIF